VIEFRRKEDENDNNFFSHEWRIHKGKSEDALFFFETYDYKIFGDVYTAKTPEFEDAFTKYLLWRNITQ